MKSPLTALSKFDFFGVLLFRIGIGALFIFHGYPIALGGAEVWTEVGSGTAILTLPDSAYKWLGLASGILQCLGGLLLVIGLFTRGIALTLSLIAGLALANLVQAMNFELAFVAHLQVTLCILALVFIGPGRFSLDRRGI